MKKNERNHNFCAVFCRLAACYTCWKFDCLKLCFACPIAGSGAGVFLFNSLPAGFSLLLFCVFEFLCFLPALPVCPLASLACLPFAAWLVLILNACKWSWCLRPHAGTAAPAAHVHVPGRAPKPATARATGAAVITMPTATAGPPLKLLSWRRFQIKMMCHKIFKQFWKYT